MVLFNFFAQVTYIDPQQVGVCFIIATPHSLDQCSAFFALSSVPALRQLLMAEFSRC
jgi:hypothetical protein